MRRLTRSDEERKQFAYLVGMVLKLARGETLDLNEEQYLDNIASDLGFFDNPEKEFRY